MSSRLIFILGSRGEWGYIKPIIDRSKEFGFDSQIFATNMSVLESFGGLAYQLEKSGYQFVGKSLSAVSGDNHAASAKSMGLINLSLVDVLFQQQPKWVVCAGDRAEQLMATVVAAYMYIPVAHIQAGERSGNIDDSARHAIARLAHLHFASNKDAEERLIRSGEQPFRVHLTGAPQLDELEEIKAIDSGVVLTKYGCSRRSYVLAVVHPVTEEFGEALKVVNHILQAIGNLEHKVVWILPNNDAGGDAIKRQILEQKREGDLAFANLPRKDFAILLREALGIIGNSSAGILEAPTFQIPSVNIGRRQINRIRGVNVIDCENTVNDIMAAITIALSPEFRDSLRNSTNPYGNGDSAMKILSILKSTTINNKLLRKEMTF